MERYDPAAVESRWQEIWQRERVFETANPSPGDDTSRLVYVLGCALPLRRAAHGPCQELHHGRRGDAVRRRHGVRVARGHDAFGWTPRTWRSRPAAIRRI
jgi:hypothetical protein